MSRGGTTAEGPFSETSPEPPDTQSYVGGERRTNVASWRDYQAAIAGGRDAVAFAETLAPREAMGEEAMVRLRLAAGLSLVAIGARWGLDAQEAWGEIIGRFASAGLLRVSEGGDRIALTERGLEVADGLIAEFVGCT